MTLIRRDLSYIEIRLCSGGSLLYQNRAYDTVKRLELEKPRNRVVLVRYSSNGPPEVLDVKLCPREKIESFKGHSFHGVRAVTERRLGVSVIRSLSFVKGVLVGNIGRSARRSQIRMHLQSLSWRYMYRLEDLQVGLGLEVVLVVASAWARLTCGWGEQYLYVDGSSSNP